MNKILVVIAILIILIGSYMYRVAYHKTVEPETPVQEQSTMEVEKTQSKQGPDYSRIKIEKVLKTDIESGKGEVLLKQKQALLDYQVYIYDPARKGNRGKLIYKTNEQGEKVFLNKKELFKGWSNSLKGLREGGKRTLIVPNSLSKEIKNFKVPEEAIVQIEVTLNKIL
ncbi:MAG: FKBP-type peptidyl-prolyl cis-trans isomerase [Bdellovibrionales bacterium]|nr:FKBP-type peptidyl-prolyl cis-trans isomerase [Bdellovibrionales bacterium]